MEGGDTSEEKTILSMEIKISKTADSTALEGQIQNHCLVDVGLGNTEEAKAEAHAEPQNEDPDDDEMEGIAGHLDPWSSNILTCPPKCKSCERNLCKKRHDRSAKQCRSMKGVQMYAKTCNTCARKKSHLQQGFPAISGIKRDLSSLAIHHWLPGLHASAANEAWLDARDARECTSCHDFYGSSNFEGHSICKGCRQQKRLRTELAKLLSSGVHHSTLARTEPFPLVPGTLTLVP